MMVSLRWVIFINLVWLFCFFFEFWQSSKRKLVGRGLFLNFCHPGNSKKKQKTIWLFFLFVWVSGILKKKAGGKMPFFFGFFLPSRKFKKKTKKKTASCFWDFFHFLNFGNPQKESWSEESFFDFFEFSKRKLVGRVLFFEFFDFFEFGPFPERKLVGSVHFFLFFLIFLIFLNFGHPGNSKKSKKKWQVFF